MGILIGTPKKTPRKGEISRCLFLLIFYILIYQYVFLLWLPIGAYKFFCKEDLLATMKKFTIYECFMFFLRENYKSLI